MKVYRQLSQILTLSGAHQKHGRNLTLEDLAILDNASIVFDENVIHWVGPDHELPSEYQKLPMLDLQGHVLTPGLVDPHTHLIFAGNRAHEYTQRLSGVDYQEIARQGGGILHTKHCTLKASEDELFTKACERVERIASFGVKTLEIKSGYALTSEGELKLLRVIAKLKQRFQGKLDIVATYMGAHAVPTEFQDSHTFLRQVVLPTMQAGARLRLIDAVDIFHEQGYFTSKDAELLFSEAKKLSLPIKLHADEFQDNHGGSLAAKWGALSADHLLKVSAQSIAELAASSTIATLLPGTAFFLGKDLPPARALLDAGCRVAIASDFNPGSSHVDNVLLVAQLAAPSLRMNLAEMWAAITLNGASALGLKDRGALIKGLKPHMSLFKATQVAEISYQWGKNLACPLP